MTSNATNVQPMILLGLGANLEGELGGPVATCTAALTRLEERGVLVAAHSPWYESAPVPISDQPWFVNAVARVETGLGPRDLLALLHEIEGVFGRIRGQRNASRTLDLDLLAYGERLSTDEELLLPHPRMHERAFVLFPLRDVAPEWTHPTLGLTPAAMIEALPPGQSIRRRGG